MNFKPVDKKYILNLRWYILACLALMVFSISMESYYNKTGYGKRELDKFNKTLSIKEKKLLEGFSQFENLYKESSDSLGLFSIIDDKFFDSFPEDGLAYFFYKDSSLVFWSDNIIPVPGELSQLSDSSIIRYGNALYYSKIKNLDSTSLYGLIHLKTEHPYMNKMLDNGFRKEFGLSDEVKIRTGSSGKNQVLNLDGEYLFSLDFNNSSKNSKVLKLLVILLWVSCFLCFIILMRRVVHNSPPSSRNLKVILTNITLIFLYILISRLQLPRIIFHMDIFSIVTIQTPIFSPNIGDLLMGTIVVFFIIYNFYIDFNFNLDSFLKRRNKTVSSLIFALISSLLYLFNALIIKFLILNTNVSFETYKVLDLSVITFLSFLILAISFAGFALFTDKLLSIYDLNKDKKEAGRYTGIIIILIVFLYFIPGGIFTNLETSIFFILFTFALYYFRFISKVQYRLSSFVVYVLLFSIFTLIEVTRYSDEKNMAEMKMMAVSLSTEHDPVAELLFVELEKNIKNDPELEDLIQIENFDFEKLYNTVQRKYFRGFWDKYDLQITVCSQRDSIYVSLPVDEWYDCYPFFYESILSEGALVPNTGVYYLDNLNGRISYFLPIVYYDSTIEEVTMFLELDSRLVLEGLGYPSLLLDESLQPAKQEYSYAKYFKQDLITSIGEFDYSTRRNVYSSQESGFENFQYDNFDHIAYHLDEDNTIIVSKPSIFWVDILISFSYIFSFYFLTLLILLIISRLSPINLSLRANFKTRIQLSMNGILFFTFILIGAGTVYFSINQYQEKQYEILEEKLQSVYIELIHKFEFESDLENWSSESYFNLEELLLKFANVFYTDINLYDSEGILLASSRPEIFGMGLLSQRMDAHAFKEMSIKKRSEFVQQEEIGRLKFLSAYVPFVNAENQLLAYLNLPYFTRQDALTREITNLVVAIINIVVLLSLLAFTISVFMANTITMPLNLLQQHISKISLSEQNEMIEYHRDDEVGSLVKEYNQMVAQLQNNVELLAKSERDAAWREMAKQIAHEIKNPLTPMKLNIQHLQRTLKENPEKAGAMADKISETLIEQIENLSAIATEFSSFAKMPQAKNVILDLEKELKKSIELFTDYERCILSLRLESKQKLKVFVDKEQISRVFINLIKNAIQAIPENEKGQIEISLARRDQMALISIRDNGKGIPEEVRGQLFQPNFTTKSSGMGLGLAIVRNIIQNAGGEVYFETEMERGSTFYVELPLVDEKA